MLVTRHIAKDTDPISLQAVSGVMATAVLLPAILICAGLGIDAQAIVNPNSVEWALLLAIGVLGTVAHLLMTWSLRFAPSATLAPMQYLEIPVGTIIGFIIFKDLPDGLATLGIIITISAGLYIILRERATARQLQTPPSPPQPAQTQPAGQ
jgi:drug/metabolite transporter (DMT)-like permease